MKTCLLTFAVLLGLAAGGFTPSAEARAPMTYVHVSTWTAGGTGTKAWAFQNTSDTLDVQILKIEVGSASGATVTSGPVQFWVMGSTVITHGGTSQTSFYSIDASNITAPSYVTVSTGPTAATYEGKQASQLPLARPLLVNLDETATTLLHDSLDFNAPSDSRELLLPAGEDRGIVIEQRQFGASDYTAGVAFVRVVYTVK